MVIDKSVFIYDFIKFNFVCTQSVKCVHSHISKIPLYLSDS